MQFLSAQTGSDPSNNFFQIVVQKDAYYDSLINIRSVDSMEGTGYTGYLRWKAFMNPRVDDSGFIASYANVIKDYYEASGRGVSSTGTYNWNYFAPSGSAIYNNEAYKDKGWVNRLYYDNSNNILYAGTHNNGIWKTSNLGNDWTCITLNAPKINGITGLTKIDNTLYALTYSNLGNYYNGLYKSNDEGTNWAYVPVHVNGTDFYGTGMKWKKRPIRLIGRKSGSNHELYLLANNYVLKSTDGGSSWSIIMEKAGKYEQEAGDNPNNYFYRLDDEGFEDIVFDKNNPDMVVVAGTEIYRSVDAGNNWQNITNDVTGFDKVITCKMDNNATNTENVWFLYVYESSTKKVRIKHMYHDGTGGYVYQNFGNEMDSYSAFTFIRSKINIKVDPNNNNNIYIGGLSLYKITDNGDFYRIVDGFSNKNNKKMHNDIRDMLVYPMGNNLTFITGCDGGVVKAWNTGDLYNNQYEIWNTEYWTVKNGDELNISEVYALDVKGNNNDCFFNCQDVGGFYKNDDKLYKITMGDGGAVTFDKVYNYVYFSDNQWGYLAGYNLDENKAINFNCGIAPDLYFYSTIVQTPGNPKVTYFGLSNLRRFNNIYEYINTGSYETVPIVETLLNDDPITDVAISSLNPDIMYVSTKRAYWWDGNTPDASTYRKGLFKSTDGGQTWSDVTAGLKGMFSGFITDIELNPDNDDELWLTFGNATYTEDDGTTQGYTRKIYRYFKDTDGTWHYEPYAFNLPNKLPVNRMVIDKFTGDKYIATDVGVFKWTGITGNEWQNISVDANGNFINKMANDIVINYQTRKMFVSTFGAGIWQTDLNDCPQYTGNIIYIKGQENWYGTKQVNGDVVIVDGGDLTIHGTVYFNQNSKVIVQPGGKLALNGAKLTNNCSGDYWQGVEIWGFGEYATRPGTMTMENHSVIENAQTAVYLGKKDNNEYAVTYGGAVFVASDCMFRNNYNDVYVTPYNGNNTNGVMRCNFEVNDDFPFALASYENPARITLNDYLDFNISGCKFINKCTGSNSGKFTGIDAYNSSVSVTDATLNGNNVTGEFTGLYRGIYFDAARANVSLSAVNLQFINNRTGIYASAADNLYIVKNTFNVPALAERSGLYLDNCPRGYTIEENKFISDNPPAENSPNYYGIVVNNSLEEEKTIYNNYFENLYYAAQAQYVNRNAGTPETGLLFKCNDFRTNIYDITVLDPKKSVYSPEGIRFQQGHEDDGSEPIEFCGANNTFTLEEKYPGDGGFKPHQYDLYNSLNTFLYWYPYGINTDIDKKTQPTLYTTATVITNKINQTEYLKDDYCPSHLDNGGGTGGSGVAENKALLTYYHSQADSLGNLIALLTDGGNTASTLSAVNNAQAGDGLQVRDMLLQKSPYLSDTVLTAVAKNEQALTAAMVRDVLVQNPRAAKMLKTGYILDHRTDTLTAYMRAQVNAGRDTLGALELLRMQQAAYLQKQTEVFNKLYLFYTSDTSVANPADSLLMLYNFAGGLFNDYREAMQYLNLADTAAADSVMSSVAAGYMLDAEQLQQHNHLQTLFTVWKSMTRDSLWLPDSSYITTLTAIADYGSGIPAVYARNILLQMEAYSYTEPYLTVDTTQLKDATNDNNGENLTALFKNSCSLKLFPNPAG
ncbi:MAG: hypothetical protein DRJ09_10880, partial [Bacteroidetes bacterium]